MPLQSLMARMKAPGIVYDYWNLFSGQSATLPSDRYYAGLGTLANISHARANAEQIVAAIQEAQP